MWWEILLYFCCKFFCWFWQWKDFENRLTSVKVMNECWVTHSLYMHISWCSGLIERQAFYILVYNMSNYMKGSCLLIISTALAYQQCRWKNCFCNKDSYFDHFCAVYIINNTFLLTVALLVRYLYFPVIMICVYVWMFWTEKNIYYQMSSFNESAGLGLLKTDAIEFVKYPCRAHIKCAILFCITFA